MDALAALGDACVAVELAPSWPKGYFRKGCCLRQLGRLEEAAKAFAMGQKLEPENKDWAKEIDKTESTLQKQPDQQVGLSEVLQASIPLPIRVLFI